MSAGLQGAAMGAIMGTYTAYIDYNDAYDRVFEEFKQGTNTLSTKHFMAGGQYEVETKAGGETQRLYLDGSPYSASVIVEKVGSAAAQPYYLHRDYLGSITQVSDKFGNLAAEYSYDAWGRMRNPLNWTLYPQGLQPTMSYGMRGYTGHEHLNQFGLINMNARLYDPVLARFLAPDPFVGSGLTNDFNRYIYCRNNPMMFTDPSGMSWKSFWQDFGNAFVRDFNKTFGNNQGGWQLGYNSSGGFFINPTYNGSAFGPSAGISNSGQITMGNSQGGFHNMTPIGQSSRLEQSAVQAEQSARGEFFGQKTFESAYNFMVNLGNLAFNQSEYDKLYGKETQQGIPIDFDNAMNVAGTTFGVGAATEEMSKLGYKNFKLVAMPFVGFNAYSAWDKASSPNATAINYLDFGMGVLDAGAALELFSRANIYVGGATLVYGLVRIGYDYYQSSSTNYYSPIYQINGKAVRLW